MGVLNTFPLSFKVKGRRIVIVGGGDEALNKARLAARTTASVRVVARVVEAGFSGLGIELLRRPFEPSDLDGAALVFVADAGPDGRAAQDEARRRAIPVNVVDVPGECDFFTPSIVERAPLTIAVGSEGDAPVLARLVRARIEAMLPPRLGPLAELAGSLRARVARMLGKTEQRRFFEEMLTSPLIEAALDRGEGESEALAMLERHAGPAPTQGVVWLIGAGPGSEDLLTLRAQRLLQEADVIVHDQLVPFAVVQMGRRDAEQICVGKAKGHHSFSQAQINALLVRLAGEGKRVARLKSGDPMVFGRAGEEIAALRRAGIGYVIVPGVSAALAAAADTATPVTLRKVSSGFVMATAHGADEDELRHWAALASAGLSIALYMGKSVASDVAARLIGAGASARTPAGIVVNAGRPDRQCYFGTLSELAGTTVHLVDGPAVILIGDAVAAGDWAEAARLSVSAAKVA